jgi:phage terminase small subunit
MARPRKPLNVIQFDKRSHLTKAFIEERKASELKLGDQVFAVPALVRSDRIAVGVWNHVVKIFQDPAAAGLVTSVDVGIIATYCKTLADYTRINLRIDDDAIRIRARLALLIARLSGELFLTPMARIRNVKKPEGNKPKSTLEEEGFGDLC